ncbi:MAG TPA: glycoside hydrolase family 1 protein [Verrucomicrobiae bacterium]|nr:glycoside hydrolase family 1 protein [Verrucomicrobiae bacterium]
MIDPAFETKLQLPGGFLLGAASAAHQVEGSNMNSDWWRHEQEGKLPVSGAAVDHYNRYEEDFKIAKQIGLNAFRISIEWSRVEPVEGKWDPVAIEHYRKVLKKMKEQGLTRMVTLHHFTLPQWLADQGGFETTKGSEALARFAWFLAQNLGDEIDLWCTFNEPGVYSTLGYIVGNWPPFKKKKFILCYRVYQNMIKAHKAAYAAIKQVLPNAQIGIANNCSYYEAADNSWLTKTGIKIAKYFNNIYFYAKISDQQDFIGINYYFYKNLSIGLRGIKFVNKEKPKSDMGWIINPEGIYHLLIDLKRFGKPIYVTENGIANARDDMRKDFIKQHLHWISQAIADGSDVRGYFYWSLTDTFEWQDGYDRFFGLVEVNRETQERKIRPSAQIFKELI